MLTAEQRFFAMMGALEATARIYPNHITVTTHNDEMRAKLRENFGGTIEGSRLIVRGVRKRQRLLSTWADNSPYREAEVLRALRRLEHPDT